ncbi:hypothetical protein KM911_00325 [Bacillus paralicheniformis]|uniref:hypothetical protein n=1 Tax=Bacillus TaxID=1386 RepID=UPI001C22FFBC|nr:hypothetical protein [Bacillus paralicheniformis]MBU8580141.1 hypothetical protein [Bacillus paralicheniformis]
MTNRIRIKLGSIEFEVEGDKDLIQNERQQFLNFLPQASAYVSHEEQKKIIDVTSETLGSSESLTIIENEKYESTANFFNKKSFNKDVELVMGTAYFIDIIEGNGPFTIKDIENKLAEARYPKPSNISRDISKNIKKGYIDEHTEKRDGLKTFRVLSEGKKWCESYIPSESTLKTRKQTTSKKNSRNSSKTKSTKKISKPNLLTNLNFRPNGKLSLKDLVKNYNIKSDMERVLFIAYYLENELGIEEITIDHLYTGFKELETKIPTALTQVIRHTQNRKGWIEINDNIINVSIHGENYIKFDAEKK